MRTTQQQTAHYPATLFTPRAAKYFLAIFTPLLLLLAATLWQFYQVERGKLLFELKTHDSQLVQTTGETIANELDTVFGDLLFVAGSGELLAFLENDDLNFLQELADEYLLFNKTKRVYDQIRFIDQTGMERIRVDSNNGSPTIIPPGRLQDKSSRYYFQATMALPPERIFMSPLDLNIENGHLERPLKPTIRFAIPLFDSHHNQRGIVVLNYLARFLLAKLSDASHMPYGQMMMLNDAGYWLHSTNPDDEWGFMFADRHERTFAKAFPGAWQLLYQSHQGQFTNPDGLFTFLHVQPLALGTASRPAPAVANGQVTVQQPSPRWTIVSHISPQRLRDLTTPLTNHFWRLFSLLLLLTWFCALLATWALAKRAAAEETTRRALAEMSQVFATVEDGIVVVDQDQTIRRVNEKFLELWEVTEHEVVGMKWFDLLPLPPGENGKLPPDPATTSPVHFEIERRQRNGRTIFCEYSAAPLRQPDGKCLGLVGCLHDVTAHKRTALALKESNDRFSLVVAGTSDGIWDWNIANDTVYFSPQWLAQSGHTAGELSGRFEEWKKLLHPADRDALITALRDYLAAGDASPFAWEYRLQHQNGDYRWFQVRGNALHDDTGAPCRMAGSQTDITASKEAAERAQWQREVDTAMAGLSSGLLSSHTLEETAASVIARAQMLTDSPLAFAGYIDTDTGNLVCPGLEKSAWHEHESCNDLWERVLQNRQPLLLNDHDSSDTGGVQKGHIPSHRFLAVPAMITDSLVGIIALANSDRDYTDRDLAALRQISTLFALAIQRRRNEDAMHRLLVGTAAVTGERFFATMVEQLAKCLGTRYVLLGEIHPETPDQVHGMAFWNGDGQGKPFDYSLPGTPCAEAHRKGFCLYERGVAQQFPDDLALADWGVQFYAGIPLRNQAGTTLGILCAMHDQPLEDVPHIHEIFQIFSNRTSAEIERKRVEDALALAKETAEKANRAKNKFLATMSHELRTPLNAIIGFAGVLLEQHFGQLNEKQLGYTAEIRKSGNHLLTVINDILDLSKIESGKMRFHPMPVCLADLLAHCLRMATPEAAERNISITLNIAPEIRNLVLEIDERKLRQALFKIVDNATKFTPAGGRITITVRRREEICTIAVADTGIGIAAENFAEIFEPFSQLNNEYQDKSPGIGLGLALSKTLIGMHDGTVTVESDGMGKGSRFTIALPIRESSFTAGKGSPSG